MNVYIWKVFKDGELIYEGDIHGAIEVCELTKEGFMACYREKRLTKKGYRIARGETKYLKYEYKVHHGEELLCSGDENVVARYLKVSNQKVRDSARLNTILDTFRITRELEYSSNVVNNQFITTKPIKHNRKLEYLRQHLSLYGNTIIRKISEKELGEHLKTLESEGIYTYYHKVIDKQDGNHYHIEVIHDKK